MPELPEVEHAKRSLDLWLVGRKITRAVIDRSRVFRGQKLSALSKELEGKKAIGTLRRGKHLLLELEGGAAIHFHLGMSGRFSLGNKQPHARLELHLDNGQIVAFRDARMFGRVELGVAEELKARFAVELGPDPWLEKVGARELLAIFAKTKRPIKVALMDQARLAGLGNIYAAEALWVARLHPEIPANEVDRPGAARLSTAIRRVLAASMTDLAETDGTYVQDAGSRNPFRVYGREGEPCVRCKKAEILKSEHGGRSTFYCPRCQALPRR